MKSLFLGGFFLRDPPRLTSHDGSNPLEWILGSGCLGMDMICTWYPKQPGLNGCLVKQPFFYVMIWNQPIETTIRNWLFGVAGIYCVYIYIYYFFVYIYV